MSPLKHRYLTGALVVLAVTGFSPAAGQPASGGGELVAIDQAVPAGIYEVTRTYSGTVHDFNRDGWPDFFFNRHMQIGRLYRNDRNGHFTEIYAGTFFDSDRHGCDWADVNQNGRPDFFCSVGADRGMGTGVDQMWMQLRASFRERAEDMGLEEPFGRGRDSTFIDVNHDPYPDLFVGNAPSKPGGDPSPNRLYLNVGGTMFQEDTDSTLKEEIGATCAQAADFDDDGWEDLLLCPHNTGGGLHLYRNDGAGGFADVASSVGLGDVDAFCLLVDMDADGRLDLVALAPDTLTVYLQRGGVFTEAFSGPVTEGNRVAAGDVNGDSVPDLYIQQGLYVPNPPDLMLLNNGSGTDFSETPIPQTDQGRADDVVPIDYDGNGLTDFLVTNGAGQYDGPLQLIAFYLQ